MVHHFILRSDPQVLFRAGQLLLATLVGVALWIVRPRQEASQFRVREADLKKKKKSTSRSDSLASAKIDLKKPLSLPGIRLDRPAHEILEIQANASEKEIQKAYRELMKRYHPDVVGRPGSREWKDAQIIAEAINRSKNEMLQKKK